MTAPLQILEAHIQTVTLIVLAFTAVAILWQAIEGQRQAKASETMAQVSRKQVELIQAQTLASFRPVLIVTEGEYGSESATLTIKNVGTGPALAIFGVYRNGVRQAVESLSAGQKTGFRFDNGNNIPPPPVFPPRIHHQPVIATERTVPLRLEYQSVSEVNCWTTAQFKVGGTGPVELEEIKHGMVLPSLNEIL